MTTSSTSNLQPDQQATALYNLLSDVYQTSPWTLDQLKADLVKPETDYFYAYDKGQLVGFLAIQLLAGEIEITNIAIKSSHQGQGLADQLMNQLVNHEPPIFLEVRESNLKAQNLYRKHGFVPVGLRKNYYHTPTEDAVLMRRG